MKKYYNINNKSFDELEVTNIKQLWDKVKGDYEALSISVETIFNKAEDSDNKFHVVFSTEKEDRHGEIVMQNWDLKAFKKNPVLLDSHNYYSIEHIIGKIKPIGVKDLQLQGDIEFCLDNPKGAMAYKMAVNGFLNATSVGFIPLQFDDKGNILKAELLEISAVSVPANPEALFEKKDIGEEKIEEKIEEETKKEDEVPVEKTIIPKKKSIVELLSEKAKQDYERLKRIAGELENTSPDNLAERKRAIYKDLRVLLTSKDNCVVDPS